MTNYVTMHILTFFFLKKKKLEAADLMLEFS